MPSFAAGSALQVLRSAVLLGVARLSAAGAFSSALCLALCAYRCRCPLLLLLCAVFAVRVQSTGSRNMSHLSASVATLVSVSTLLCIVPRARTNHAPHRSILTLSPPSPTLHRMILLHHHLLQHAFERRPCHDTKKRKANTTQDKQGPTREKTTPAAASL